MSGVTPHANSFISSRTAPAQGALGVIVKAHMWVHVCEYCLRGDAVEMLQYMTVATFRHKYYPV